MPPPLAKLIVSADDGVVEGGAGVWPRVGAAPPSFRIEADCEYCSAGVASLFFNFEASGDSPPFIIRCCCDMDFSFGDVVDQATMT
jgi:hypothetical protein